MRIRWPPEAVEDLQNIHGYLRLEYPSHAQTTVNTLYDGLKALRTFPYRGRPGHEPGMRELVFTNLPYIATYRIKNETVEILYIRHGAQDR